MSPHPVLRLRLQFIVVDGDAPVIAPPKKYAQALVSQLPARPCQTWLHVVFFADSFWPIKWSIWSVVQ